MSENPKSNRTHNDLRVLDFTSKHADWSCLITRDCESRFVVRNISNRSFYCDSLVFGWFKYSDVNIVKRKLREEGMGIIGPISGRNLWFGNRSSDNFVLVLRILTRSNAPSTISKYAYEANVNVIFPLIDNGIEHVLAVGQEDHIEKFEKLCKNEKAGFIENQKDCVFTYESHLEKIYQHFCSFLSFTEQEKKIFLATKMFGLDMRPNDERLLELATKYIFGKDEVSFLEENRILRQIHHILNTVYKSLWLTNGLLREFYSLRSEVPTFLYSL